MVRGLVAAALGFLVVGSQGRFDPARGAIDRLAPQPIYSADAADPWNRLFFLLFTRAVRARVIADGAAPFAAGDERLRVSDRSVTRIESGDRAIDPLYPSWTWMGSASFDFAPGEPWRILRDAQSSQVRAALEGVRRTAGSRTPMARALMQADLWSVHDMLHALTVARGIAPAWRDRVDRASELRPLVVSTMRALALTREEIARLPDTYRAAMKALTLPDLTAREGGWIEFRWFPTRSHYSAAEFRRASRVFLKPRGTPPNPAAFLDAFRERPGDDRGTLDSVALLTQLMLVARDGTVMPSPIAYEVQLRGNAARTRDGDTPQYELSRRRLLSSPATGGLVPFAATAAVYMPMAGNDLSFATPPRLDGDPVVAPLSTRCAACHGGTGVGHIVTFSMTTGPGVAIPHVEQLNSAANPHAGSVAAKKMGQESYKALRALWR